MKDVLKKTHRGLGKIRFLSLIRLGEIRLG